MSQISIGCTYTDVRGGGFGRTAWIARVVGRDPKYGFKRVFCRRDMSGLSGSGRSGVIRFDVNSPGIYEFRDFCVGSTPRNWRWSGFIRLLEDGTSKELTREQVEHLLDTQEAAA